MKGIVLACIFLIFSVTTFSQEIVPKYEKNQLIVKFKPDAQPNFRSCIIKQKFDIEELDALNKEKGIQSIKTTGNKKIGDTYLLKFNGDQNIEELIKTYENTGLFEYVEPNYIGSGGGNQGLLNTIPTDVHFSRQYGLLNDGSFTLSPAKEDADIDMDLAWDIEKGDSSIIVAVLDAGLKMDHPEFDGRLWQNSNEALDGTDTDNNGFVDDLLGWDFVNNDNDPTDDHGHGTNVTGIVCANGNNTIGYAGVDWNCKLMVCKILNQNNLGQYSNWAEAIYYAVDNGARVLNMSVGGFSFSTLLKDAVDYAHSKDVTIVACMMNFNTSDPYYPAAFSSTIAVGSTDPNDVRTAPFFWSPTSGSNYGSHIDVVAPGNYIYGLSYQSSTNYNSYWGGTSQATPLVAGVCALLLAQNPNRTPDELRSIIRNNAEDQVGDPSEDIAGFDVYYGYGRLNAHYSLLGYKVGVEKENILEKVEVSVYPNPSFGQIKIKNNVDFAHITITNLMGQQMFSGSFQNQNVIELDVEFLPNGIYLIHVLDQSEMPIASHRIVLN